MLDDTGVDLKSGQLMTTYGRITIGNPGNPTLAYAQFGATSSSNQATPLEGGIYTECEAVNAQPCARSYTRVRIGEQVQATTAYSSDTTEGMTISYSTPTGAYTVTDLDGTEYIFLKSLTNQTAPGTYQGWTERARLSQITRPNGERLSYVYGPQVSYGSRQVISVSSSYGYQLHIEGDYRSPNRVILLNTLSEMCDPAAATCPNLTYNWPKYTIARTGALQTSTDASGAAAKLNGWTATGGQYEATMTFTSPAGVVSKFTRNIPNMQSCPGNYSDIVTKVERSGATWTYQYSLLCLPGFDSVQGVQVTRPALGPNSLSHGAALGSYYGVNGLNKSTQYKFTVASQPGYLWSDMDMQYVIYPEGDRIDYTYDTRRNVIQTVRTPKPNSGGTATSTTSGFVATCTYPKTCNQPIWTKDAKGNQTDFTYDPNGLHGGVLTITLPANAAGLRLRTYNTYTAFDTGNGVIYRLTRSDTCGLTSAQLSLTACPAAITTSVTLIDYGTAATAPYTYKSLQPYKVTNRDGRVTAPDLQTTTYGYDRLGSIAWVDGPLAGTVDQSFTTYDANRRKIFEIGPIPGGTGTQKRSLIRHTYNSDGNETQTAFGYANTNATNGSDAVYTSYNRMTYDTAGRLIKSEVISKDVVVP